MAVLKSLRENGPMEALIFDMDGLMIDSERLYFEAEKEIARKFRKEVKDETLWRMMGRKPLESLRVLAEELGISESPEELLRIRNAIMRQKLKSDLKPMPGLAYIIDCFSGKLKLAVATGAQKEFLDIAVDTLGIREKFALLQPSDDIAKGKPDPEIYLTVCKKLGVLPERSIVLEDSENGIMAAKRAGCYAVAVPSEYSQKQDFSRADFISPSLFHAAGHIAEMIE